MNNYNNYPTDEELQEMARVFGWNNNEKEPFND